MNNPYKSPKSKQSLSPYQAMNYGGIGRFSYILITIVLSLLPFLVIFGPVYGEIEYGVTIDLNFSVEVALIILVIYFFISFVPIYYRLKNIGMNPWLCLLTLVPFVNLIIALACLVCQKGYQDTKKLDYVGKMLIFIGVAIISLIAFGLIYLNNAV